MKKWEVLFGGLPVCFNASQPKGVQYTVYKNMVYNRKISGILTPLFKKLGIHPNVVTLLGLLSGMLAGWYISKGSWGFLLLGTVFLHLAFILDNCDGELARLQNKVTVLGKRLDVTADLCVDFALWLGLYYGCLAVGMRSVDLNPYLLAASIGSLANFGMTLWERAYGRSLSYHTRENDSARPKSLYSKFIQLVAHNGNSVALAWPFAILGWHWEFLFLGTIFINGLWISRLCLNFQAFAEWAQKAFNPILHWVGWGVAGIFLFFLVQDMDWMNVANLLTRIGPGLLLILAVYPVGSFIHMMGFYALLSEETKSKLSLGKLFSVFLVGESVNKVTPFMDIGGEPLKVALAHQHKLLHPSEAVAVVYMSRILFIATEILFIFLGIAALYWVGPSQEIAILGAIGIFMSFILVLFFILGSRKGLRFLASKLSASPDDTEKTFQELCHSRKGSILLSGLWCLAGWIFFFWEVYLTLQLLGVPVTLTQALIIQALSQAVTTASFFVPAQLGTQEHGFIFLLSHFNIASAYGLVLSLVKRFRQVVWFVLSLPFLPVFGVKNR